MAFTAFTASDLAATVVLPEDDLCVAIEKLEKAMRYAYQYAKHKYNPDGSISPNYCQEIKDCLAKANTTSAA